MALLMLVSMSAWADVKVVFGENGSDSFEGTGGKIAVAQEISGTDVTVTLTVTPDKDQGYTISKSDIEVYATIASGGTRTPEIASTLELKGDDPTDLSDERKYTVSITPNFGVWVKSANFQPKKRDGAKGGAEDTPDYSGVYYIGSRDYKVNNLPSNYYLCPTEGWAFYKATNSVTGTDNGQPFLTTYQCKDGIYDAIKSVWIIEKHLTEPDCYYIIQGLTGRYMISNGKISDGNARRMRVHLETVSDPASLDDKALFEITSHSDHLDIIPHSTEGRNGINEKYLVVNNGNKNQLDGESSKNDGPTDFKPTGGIIGLYSHEDNAEFYLEKAALITNNYNGTFTITASTGSTIYYTIDETTPTTSTTTQGTTSVIVNQTEDMTVIKAIAKGESDANPTDITTYELPRCERPVFTINDVNVTITCATEGAIIHYTIDGNPATSSSPIYTGPFGIGDISTIRAIATRSGFVNSSESEAALLPPAVVYSSSEIEMSGNYILADNFILDGSIGTSDNPFSGTIDGNMVIRSLSYPLVAYADGATIKNVILDNISISGGTNVGAICNEAKGDTRIYNCGILATNSLVMIDEDGYTHITNCSSTVSGSDNVGGIVGRLTGNSRVINCFSYANITSGITVGGIVGNNDVTTATTSSNINTINTMVMNCMFYGDITGGTSKAPIYNGKKITNAGSTGVGNYNYFYGEASYVQPTGVTYNCALMAETRFLQRFEFFRHLLNSHRELAAWWATGDYTNKDEMAKWVLLPSQIGSSTPYPVLAKPGYYPSVVNIDAENATTQAERNKGGLLGTLSVTIQMGDGAQFKHPEGAVIVRSSLTLNITDKDPEHFNFNYYKVQLPYYNDVGTKNYTGNRVVAGWKIVNITGGTPGTFSTETDDAPSFNFADRKCTNKDLYSTSGRVFNQGAYWDVPEGVTAITIEPYWAKAVYLADANADKVYNDVMETPYDVLNVGDGTVYTNGSSYPIAGNNQVVYTNSSSAVTALNPNSSHTVYDYAIVLVGNYHYHNGVTSGNANQPYTIMSADFDHDNEPDYSYILRFNGRTATHPVRVDFLNIPGLGMAQKSTGGTGSYNFGIMQPKGWFEATNTSLFRVTQFEYDRSDRGEAPYILQSGVMEQWVSGQSNGAANKTTYYHVGGNVWFKEFHRGTHQDKDYTSKHPPISVTGGDFDEFYLTGLYRADVTNYDDNAECYINGGRFGVVAGTGMEGIGNASTHTNGNITWQIQNADIREFYGGGINAAKIAEGNITTTITGGKIDLFCGGPKFGDMNSGKTVVTTATGCEFGTFFGAGYGGNSYSRRAPTNKNNVTNIDWNTWVRQEYKNASAGDDFPGISTQFSYQFIPMSDNKTNVARLFVEHISFSLATTHNVTSTLTDCVITGNFYGGGSLGKVDGPVTSTLTNCEVRGNVFGAGFSAALPTVEVDAIGFEVEPYYYEALGNYRMGVKGATTTYTWEHGDAIGINKTDHILYTTEDLNTLGTVTGDATLNITGSTTVAGDVYGGGESSNVTGNTTVNILP